VLVLHFDLTSPAAAVAVLRLQRLADEGLPIAFSGLDVLGTEVALPPTLDQLEELERDRARAGDLGLTMRRPSRRPPTLPAHLVGELAEATGRGAAWRSAALEAYWTHDADLADVTTLVELATAVGLDPAVVRGLLGERRRAIALRQRMLDTRRRGVGGVPVLEAGGTLVGTDLGDDELRALAAL
jgi:predicted DsbA family dithiol-disulfide isomerase